jgi:hypothetical protein
VVSLVGAILAAQSSHALVVVPICGAAGAAPQCALGPVATHPEDRTIEYEPTGATANQFTEEGLFTSGWINVLVAPSILLVAQDDSEIRSIQGTPSIPNLYPDLGSVSAQADGVALGTFAPGESIDFETLLGRGATSVLLTLGNADASLASWLVAMRDFEPVSDPLARTPAHVLVSFPVPEPSPGALLPAGLALLAATAPRWRGRHSRT